MKRMPLTGALLVAAALLLTGCSSIQPCFASAPLQENSSLKPASPQTSNWLTDEIFMGVIGAAASFTSR